MEEGREREEEWRVEKRRGEKRRGEEKRKLGVKWDTGVLGDLEGWSRVCMWSAYTISQQCSQEETSLMPHWSTRLAEKGIRTLQKGSQVDFLHLSAEVQSLRPSLSSSFQVTYEGFLTSCFKLLGFSKALPHFSAQSPTGAQWSDHCMTPSTSESETGRLFWVKSHPRPHSEALSKQASK